MGTCPALGSNQLAAARGLFPGLGCICSEAGSWAENKGPQWQQLMSKHTRQSPIRSPSVVCLDCPTVFPRTM